MVESWPNEAAAAAALDAEIVAIHTKFCTERGECEESEAGIRGVQWHPEVIKRAVTKVDFHFHTVHIDNTHPQKVVLKEMLKDGMYFVIGLTNNQWYKGKRRCLKYPNEPINGPVVSPEKWSHSIAIVDGCIRDGGVYAPLSSLFLGTNNQPNPSKGYMRSIRKVWRVFPCGNPGTGCKGKCGACSGPVVKRPAKEDSASSRKKAKALQSCA